MALAGERELMNADPLMTLRDPGGSVRLTGRPAGDDQRPRTRLATSAGRRLNDADGVIGDQQRTTAGKPPGIPARCGIWPRLRRGGLWTRWAAI